MRDKVELIIDEFVDEILANSQFYQESGRKRYHPRYVAVSKFINKLIFSFDQLRENDAHHIRKMFAKLHRDNYKSVHREKLIFDREWVLRQFEMKLFGNDNVFRHVYRQMQDQNKLIPGYEVDFSLDHQLQELLTDFEELGVSFNKGDIWQIGGKKYRVEGFFAKSDLWLHNMEEDVAVVRLRELLPLGLGDFYQIAEGDNLIKANSF